MADKRIKDLATTATSPAGDDFIAIDGTANNTRKILADSFALDEDIPLTPTFVYDGTAETTEFIVGDIPEDWKKNNTDITQLSIGNSAIAIESGAFYNCPNLTGILTIPNSVTSIGSYAFYFCSGFTGDLTIPNSVTTIGGSAFMDCSGFTGNLTIGNSVTTIGISAFMDCLGFTGTLTIPNSVTTMGNGAF
jgi:hypothetical protein